MSARSARLIWWALLVSVALLVLGLRISAGLQVQTDIRALLPASDRTPFVQDMIDRLQNQSLGRTIIVLGSPNPQVVDAAAEAVRNRMNASTAFRLEDIAEPGSVQPPQPLRQSAALLLTPADRQDLQEQDARFWVERAQRRLLGWGAMTARTRFAEDPFGLFDRYLQHAVPHSAWEPRGPCLHKQEAGQHWCLLILNAREQGFGLAALRAQREQLDAAIAAAREAAPEVQVLDAGVSRHADYAAATSKQEMGRISLVSVCAITLLALGMMRSLRPLLWVLVVIASGALTGLAASALFFAKLHLVALVFGTTLVGIAVDYVFHFLTASGEPPQRLSQVRSGLFWGFLTTATAFTALGFAHIPALQQVAITAVAGLAGALLSVHCLLPVIPERWLGGPRPGLLAVARRLRPAAPRHARAATFAIAVVVLTGRGVVGGDNGAERRERPGFAPGQSGPAGARCTGPTGCARTGCRTECADSRA